MNTKYKTALAIDGDIMRLVLILKPELRFIDEDAYKNRNTQIGRINHYIYE